MSLCNLNDAKDQASRPSGPIPNGSCVLVKLTIKDPKYPYSEMEMVAQAQSGILYLDAEYEVLSGTYQGAPIWENLFLPVELQTLTMSNGQKTACDIAASKIKAIMNAAHKLDPKDESPEAQRKRVVKSSWLELNGLIFPIIVGINKQQTTDSKGRKYWNNNVYRIVTPDHADYQDLMGGGEIITDGPKTGDGESDNTSYNGQGQETPPTSSYDDVPF